MGITVFEDKEMNIAYWLNFAFYIIYAVTYLIFVSLFFYLRNNEPIKSRGWVTSLTQTAMGHFFFFVIAMDSRIVGCFLENSTTVVMLPTTVYPYFLRAMQLWLNNKIHQSLLYSSYAPTQANTDRADFEMRMSFSSTSSSQVRSQNTTTFERNSKETAGGVESIQRNGRFVTWAIKNRWIGETKFQVLSQIVIFLIALSLTLIYSYLEEDFYPPEIKNDFSILVASRCKKKNTMMWGTLGVAFAILGMITSIIALWNVKDELLFKVELKANLFLGIFFFVLWIIPHLTPNYTFFLRSLVVSEMAIASFFCTTIIMSVYESFRRRKIYSKEKFATQGASSIGGSNSILDQIMDDPRISKSFQEFCALHWCYENYLFYQSIREYKKMNEQERKIESTKIWKTFFTGEIEALEINIDDEVRREICTKINQGDYQLEIFDQALKTVYSMLRYDILPLWKQKNPNLFID